MHFQGRVHLHQNISNRKKAHFLIAQVYGCVSDKLELVHRKLRQDTHRNKWEVCDWTDETDQMILILQSLVAHRGQVNISLLLLGKSVRCFCSNFKHILLE